MQLLQYGKHVYRIEHSDPLASIQSVHVINVCEDESLGFSSIKYSV